MSRNVLTKIFLSLLVLIMMGSFTACGPMDIVPVPTDARPTKAPTTAVAQNSICGWIENSSTTGVMAPTMTISGTGQILQLWNLEADAIPKLNYTSPAWFIVHDPVYQAPDLLVNFSSIQQVSACPSSAATTICGWIENTSTTGAMAPTMTVAGTGQVLQLWNLEADAIPKLNYTSPAWFIVNNPVYQAPDLLVNFSSIQQVSACPSSAAIAICGWIENTSTTGAMAPTMTVASTGQVLQLWNLESDAITKLNYTSPAWFVVHDPVYQAPDLLVNFSSVQQVSACPPAQTDSTDPGRVAYVSGFAGNWDTNWGDMTCNVNGQTVNCTYTHDAGKIEASLSQDGVTMDGTWSESPSYLPPDDAGRVTFTLSADGKSMSGHWWYGPDSGGGDWTGNRK
jgi:hypothetical protein